MKAMKVRKVYVATDGDMVLRMQQAFDGHNVRWLEVEIVHDGEPIGTVDVMIDDLSEMVAEMCMEQEP